MKKFLLRVLVFSAVATAGCAALLVLTLVLNRNAIENCKLAPGVEALIVGDSHTAWAIDDAGIEGVQNISMNAEGYRYTYLKLRHLLESDDRIRKVYLGFSYHNLSGYYDDYIDGPTFASLVERYLPVLSLRDYLALLAKNPRHAADFILRTIRKGLPAGVRGRCPMLGRFSDQHMTATFDPYSMEKRIAEQYYLEDDLYAPSASNMEYLGRIVELTREHDVELVVLNTPMQAAYRRRIPHDYVQKYDEFVVSHGLRRFDFDDLQLGDSDFLPDGDHTNYSGAMLTSKRFAEYHRASGNDAD